MLFSFPVGRDRTAESVAAVRDPRQRETVARIVAQPDFDFACNNPFVPEVGDYVGPFSFLYYTKDEQLHAVRIAKTGRVMRHLTP